MKISCEIPIKYLKDVYPLTDLPFIINIYRHIPEYVEYYQKACKEADISFLDTGAFEIGFHGLDIPITTEGIKEGIEIFKPKYVVAPEVLGDSRGTIEAIKKFKKEIEGTDVQICGVVQGSSLPDAILCFQELQNIVDIIAIPFVFPYEGKEVNKDPIISSMADKTLRRALVRIKVVNAMLRGGSKVPVHLLGMNCPLEISGLSHHPEIISTDSSSAVQHGLAGIVYTPEGVIPGGKIPQEKEYIQKDGLLHPCQLDAIKKNLKILKGL